MSTLKIFKSNTLPAILVDNALYFIKSGTNLFLYLTDSTGTIIYRTYNSSDIVTIINTLIDSYRNIAGGLVSISLDNEIETLLTFNTNTVGPAFALGTNTSGQLITGLNAEKLNGYTLSQVLATIQNQQIIYSGDVYNTAGSTTLPNDNTTPLVTEGTQLWSKTLTPTDIDSSFDISFGGYVDSSVNNLSIVLALFRDSTFIGAAVSGISGSSNFRSVPLSINIIDKPYKTTPVVYSCRIGISTSGYTWYFNRTVNYSLGGNNKTTYKIIERLP